jgi:hypothetical protein
MAEILLPGYDYYHSFGIFTYLTSNLNNSEIEKQYALRVRSMLREMYNLVAFARDKRK